MLDLDWSDLESHVTADGVFAPPARKSAGAQPHAGPRSGFAGIDAKVIKFPCQKCQGTGFYRGARVHQEKSHCFACGGKGHFLTSERDRQNARVTSAARKARNIAETRAAFDAANPGVAEFVAASARWSSFAGELVGKLNQYGSLTDGQLRAVRSMQAKCAARQEARAVARVAEIANAATVDLAPIRAMFESAVQNGYKRPVYRAAGVVISRAPMTGKNPGALYVKSIDTDEYLGKLTGVTYTGKPCPALTAIAADPKGEAVRFGQRTGTCSCCGRTLTNHASIELGIGPICAEKWNL